MIEKICALFRTKIKYMKSSCQNLHIMHVFIICEFNTLKKTQKDIEEVRKLFFSMAKAYTVQEFEECMGWLNEISPNQCAYLIKGDFKKWSKCHATIKRTWILTSNIAESINKVIRAARKLPVMSLLEYMRKTIQTSNEKHNEEGTKTTITTKYNTLLKDKTLSKHMTVSMHYSVYVIGDVLVYTLTIYFNKGTCVNIIFLTVTHGAKRLVFVYILNV